MLFPTKNLTLSAVFVALGLVLPFLTGQIPTVGNMLLPMHLPVLLCGFVCGWQYGLIVGLITPILRSTAFGMPVMLPTALAMAFELAAYGAMTGLFYRILPKRHYFVPVALILAMLVGRGIWGLAAWGFFTLAKQPFSLEIFLAGAFINAFPGMLIQLILVPVIVASLQRARLIPSEYYLTPSIYKRYAALFDYVDAAVKESDRTVIAIDGMSAAGKTSLANILAAQYNANVIRMDDFFLPVDEREEDGIHRIGGNIDLERLKETLDSIDRPYSYIPYSCKLNRMLQERIVTPRPLTIVEGTYSMLPELLDRYDLKVFLKVKRDLQGFRIVLRNGINAKAFFGLWLPKEREYFAVNNPEAEADMVFPVRRKQPKSAE